MCVCVSKDIGADASHTHTESLSDDKKEKPDGITLNGVHYSQAAVDTYNKTIHRLQALPYVGKLIMPRMDSLNTILESVNGSWALFWDITAQMENNPNLLDKNRYFSRAFKSYKTNNKMS